MRAPAGCVACALARASDGLAFVHGNDTRGTRLLHFCAALAARLCLLSPRMPSSCRPASPPAIPSHPPSSPHPIPSSTLHPPIATTPPTHWRRLCGGVSATATGVGCRSRGSRRLRGTGGVFEVRCVRGGCDGAETEGGCAGRWRGAGARRPSWRLLAMHDVLRRGRGGARRGGGGGGCLLARLAAAAQRWARARVHGARPLASWRTRGGFVVSSGVRSSPSRMQRRWWTRRCEGKGGHAGVWCGIRCILVCISAIPGGGTRGGF